MQAVSATDHQLAEQLLLLWKQLARGSVSKVFGELEEQGLGLAQLKTLDALEACDYEPTLKDLAERLGLSLPGMSRNVDGLLRRGLIERREDAHDRRMKRLKITDDGRAVLERVNSARLHGLEAFAASLPEDQCEHLVAALSPVTEGLR